LESLKLDTVGHGSQLIPVLNDRLPDEVNVIVSRKFGENMWTLDEGMEYSNDELSAQEYCSSPHNESEKHRKAGYYATGGLFLSSK
jgi:hypothetical protein